MGRILLDYTLIEVDDEPLIETKVVSGLDRRERSIYDCRFDLDNIAESASTTQAETITVRHHPRGDILKKSSQGSFKVGEYLHEMYYHVLISDFMDNFLIFLLTLSLGS